MQKIILGLSYADNYYYYMESIAQIFSWKV